MGSEFQALGSLMGGRLNMKAESSPVGPPGTKYDTSTFPEGGTGTSSMKLQMNLSMGMALGVRDRR